MEVAIQTSGPLGGILADVAGTCEAPLETLVRIQEAIPYPTVALARADLVVTSRINSMLPEDTSPTDLARWRSTLGLCFAQLGRPAEALPMTQEAVEIRRELPAAHPDRYRLDLARSLTNLGVRLLGLGRPAEGLPVAQEAVTAYRLLAAASLDRYRPGLAAALDNLGVLFSQLGRPADASAAQEEALTIRTLVRLEGGLVGFDHDAD